MAIIDSIRFWFLGLYFLGIASTFIMVIRLRACRNTIEKKMGPLLSPEFFIPLGIPLLILLLRVGKMSTVLLLMRYAGVAVSLYFLVMLPWLLRALGHFALSAAGIYQGHELVTFGPYRFVRHPLYSGATELWPGAGLGTLNWFLFALWSIFVRVVIFVPVRHEEELLREKFGNTFEDYAQQTNRLIPRFRGQG